LWNKKNMPVKLYSFPTSPYGWKVGCYLAYKQLDYEFIGVSPITYKQIAFANKKQVPVLSIGEKWMFESSDIGIWLDETFPEKPLLGKSEAEKEVILSLDKWVSHV